MSKKNRPAHIKHKIKINDAAEQRAEAWQEL
jgi:hypothetical protein